MLFKENFADTRTSSWQRPRDVKVNFFFLIRFALSAKECFFYVKWNEQIVRHNGTESILTHRRGFTARRDQGNFEKIVRESPLPVGGGGDSDAGYYLSTRAEILKLIVNETNVFRIRVAAAPRAIAPRGSSVHRRRWRETHHPRAAVRESCGSQTLPSLYKTRVHAHVLSYRAQGHKTHSHTRENTVSIN